MSAEFTRAHAPRRAMGRFGHLQRRWNDEHRMPSVKLLPGEYYVTRDNELITTLLGSCISACVRDRVNGIGGMNHFMLPMPTAPGYDDGGAWGGVAGRATRYGSAAMEQLINDVLKHGGERADLEIKIFGGGRVLARMTDVGRRNIEFAERYLATEGLRVVARDVGNVYARELHYFPLSGLARVRHLQRQNREMIAARERAYQKHLATDQLTGEVELF